MMDRLEGLGWFLLAIGIVAGLAVIDNYYGRTTQIACLVPLAFLFGFVVGRNWNSI